MHKNRSQFGVMRKTFFLLLCVLVSWPAFADNKHVVELFTSQGCYSCPAADRLLGELIEERSDIVALEFHVDYWDDLVYGTAGRWSDPFSDNAYTQRQRQYNGRGLEGNSGVYTPQAVVNGRTGVVGSKQHALDRLLAGMVPDTARISVRPEAGVMRVRVDGDKPTETAGVWLYRFDVRKVTEVAAGENKGKTLVNHHVVREVRRIGDWQGRDMEYVVEDFAPGDGQGCAVVVQRPDLGSILGADLCPS